MKLKDFIENFPVGLHLVFKSQGDDKFFTTSDKVLAFRRAPGDVAYGMFEDGEREALKPFTEIREKLKALGHWFHCRRELFINLNRVRKVLRIDSDDYLLISDSGIEFPLTITYYERVRKYFAIPTLDHITPFSLPSYWKIRLGIEDIPLKTPLLFMSEKKIKELFANQSGDIVASHLITNFLWQQIRLIRSGKDSPVEDGNVRSLWYLMKPLLSRLGMLEGSNHYKTLSQKLAEMVSHKICSYKEFGLYEEGNWLIGKKNPHIILMAEKAAHYRILERIAKPMGATVISTRGQPKTITSEYFTTALKKKVPGYHLQDQVIVIALVDYDPAGDIILETFRQDLRVFGIKNPKVINLSVVKNYSKKELKYMHYDLLKEGEEEGKIIKRWLKKTGGINGKALGMEVDVLFMNRPRVKKLIKTTAKPYLGLAKKPKLRMDIFEPDDFEEDEILFDNESTWSRFT